ncbi:FlgJ family peptidoglycan hydrolase OS=Leclercia adecarboxylata ATCC 23216 = NBRC 102595 GN=flgJ PE=4 SV=1: Rod-binding [Gemmata massiliana]|uniref:Flagellar protein FlgJ N-terminal domain-containing protein n=2 Tax=Gemmata massiliana TaxID=1210884 RepID=A0A6P2D7P7_9BACT|nr:FlgJ family peptidoglycan hydrolase OS=Leclercia adecarboxylata ATCC 23216 = NBRC 102595 GN=flgJ PE=4 SV=1: Rod-binding [Gemmata massiliana]
MIGTESIASMTTISDPYAAKSGATVQSKADSRLKNMAGEMEATFLSMLLKEMRQTLDPEEGGGMFPGDSGDVQGGLFDLYLGRHMADGGGIGLATALVRQMQNAGAVPKTVTPTDAHSAPTAFDHHRDVPPAPAG